ncbi:MAG: hypothetical protein NC922_06885 [Candidatus Omnitrophica bacterium]|nr:hypothetical protein [Candidatus Omnitrophota bacterium]
MKVLTPIEAIKKRCKECLGYEQDPKECNGKETEGLIGTQEDIIGRNYECPLYLYRTGNRPLKEEKSRLKELNIKILSPIKAIKEYCLRCCNGDRKYLKNCPSQDCPLWEYRLGKNPHLKGKRKKPIGLRPIKIGVKNGS